MQKTGFLLQSFAILPYLLNNQKIYKSISASIPLASVVKFIFKE